MYDQHCISFEKCQGMLRFYWNKQVWTNLVAAPAAPASVRKQCEKATSFNGNDASGNILSIYIPPTGTSAVPARQRSVPSTEYACDTQHQHLSFDKPVSALDLAICREWEHMGFYWKGSRGKKPACFDHRVGIHISQEQWSAQGLEYSKEQSPSTGAVKVSSLWVPTPAALPHF